MTTHTRQGKVITVTCDHPRHRGGRAWTVARYMGTGPGSPVDWVELHGASAAFKAEHRRRAAGIPTPDNGSALAAAAELNTFPGRSTNKPGHLFYYQDGKRLRPNASDMQAFKDGAVERRVILWCDRCGRAGGTPEVRCAEEQLGRLLDLLHAAGRDTVTVRELDRVLQHLGHP